jgi:ADP-dependent phosphofructokinase/glucokinase
MHHRRHRRRFGRPGVGHRFYEPERVLERLEEYQRDLEQELADVADLISRLKQGKTETV